MNGAMLATWNELEKELRIRWTYKFSIVVEAVMMGAIFLGHHLLHDRRRPAVSALGSGPRRLHHLVLCADRNRQDELGPA